MQNSSRPDRKLPAQGLGILLVLSVLLLSFQNCAKTDFDQAPSESATLGSNENPENPENPEDPNNPSNPNTPLPPPGTPPTDPDPSKPTLSQNFQVDSKTNSPADLLFVVDESISMDAILNKMKDGFSSLAKSDYPAGTLMAVTNMQPAWVKGDGKTDYKRGYSSEKNHWKQPGFMDFVRRSTIKDFKQAVSGMGSKFPLAGCDQAWFEPDAVDANGKSCLRGATQTALVAIGAEVGTVSLRQLVSLRLSNGQRSFRSGSIANVVFVSDTHDPGKSGYYGNTGADASRISPTALKNLIMTANPGILGVKFHGIVPLPAAGHTVLNGLKVVGSLPSKTEEVSTESLYGYSYLDFIKATGGVAMHVKDNNWSSSVASIAAQLGALKETAVVKLASPTSAIVAVYVDNQQLSSSQYTLMSDMQTIEIKRAAGWPAVISIKVSYK